MRCRARSACSLQATAQRYLAKRDRTAPLRGSPSESDDRFRYYFLSSCYHVLCVLARQPLRVRVSRRKPLSKFPTARDLFECRQLHVPPSITGRAATPPYRGYQEEKPRSHSMLHPVARRSTAQRDQHAYYVYTLMHATATQTVSSTPKASTPPHKAG